MSVLEFCLVLKVVYRNWSISLINTWIWKLFDVLTSVSRILLFLSRSYDFTSLFYYAFKDIQKQKVAHRNLIFFLSVQNLTKFFLNFPGDNMKNPSMNDASLLKKKCNIRSK